MRVYMCSRLGGASNVNHMLRLSPKMYTATTLAIFLFFDEIMWVSQLFLESLGNFYLGTI